MSNTPTISHPPNVTAPSAIPNVRAAAGVMARTIVRSSVRPTARPNALRAAVSAPNPENAAICSALAAAPDQHRRNVWPARTSMTMGSASRSVHLCRGKFITEAPYARNIPFNIPLRHPQIQSNQLLVGAESRWQIRLWSDLREELSGTFTQG